MTEKWNFNIARDVIGLVWDTLPLDLKISLIRDGGPTPDANLFSEVGFRVWIGVRYSQSEEETEKRVQEVYRRSKLEAFK